MKIAINAHLLSGQASYRSAGIHGYIYNTLRHLPSALPDATFDVLVGEGQPPADPALQVLRSRMRTAHPVMRILWEQTVAPWVLRRLQPDLLHGMAFVNPLPWPGRAVVTIYDLSFIRYPQRLSAARRAYLRLFTRISARRAERVIAISQSGRDEIVDLLRIPAERVDVAPPGVRESFYPRPREAVEAFRREKGLPERFILHVGTIEPRKNLETLIRAYTQLAQRERVSLVLVGGRGWQTDPMFALIDSLGVDVILPGYVPDEELPLWYSAADLLAYPSVYEGFGIPIIEAAACGIAIIASSSTSLPEAAGPGSVILPPNDVSAWAQALARLLDDEEERRARAEAAQTHAQRFTWKQTAEQTASAYRKVL